MITQHHYEQLRPATLNDIAGLLDLLEPLERRGMLVARSRERLEHEIDDYLVIERDGMVIGCAALHIFPQADIAELTRRLPESFPWIYSDEFMRRFGFETRLAPLKEYHIGDMGRHLWLLFAMVALVLLVALANVVNLFLVRIESRHQELMVRAALGARMWQLGRYVLTQSMMMAGISAILALGAAYFGVQWLMSRVPETLPRADNVGLDAIVVAFVIALAMIVGVLWTLFVLVRLRADAATPNVGGESHRATAGFRQQRIRAGLVAAQIAIAVVLLVGAGMLLQSFIKLSNLDPGFDPDGVVRMQLHLPVESYRRHAEVWQFYRELLERTEALPGVESVGAGNPLPLSGEFGCWGQGFEDAIVEQRMRERGGTSCGEIVVTTPGFFEALGIPIIAGRTLTPGDLDHPETRAVVVSQAFAERPGGACCESSILSCGGGRRRPSRKLAGRRACGGDLLPHHSRTW